MGRPVRLLLRANRPASQSAGRSGRYRRNSRSGRFTLPEIAGRRAQPRQFVRGRR